MNSRRVKEGIVLEQTSSFVLNVLPYVIVAVCGTAIMPGLFH
jgi:hypothetical protein